MGARHDENGDTAQPTLSEAALRTMLAHGLRDIDAGRTVPLGPVLDRVRQTAEPVWQNRVTNLGAPRAGWAEVAAEIASTEDDGLAWPEFGNDGDAALKW
jgi:hypothetical protein